jgi:hypothetical protein
MPPAESDDPRRAEALAVLTSTACPFSDLSPELLNSLLATMRVREYGAGELVIRQADQGDDLFVLLDGTAEAFIRHAASDHTKVGEFRPGDVVGEISMLTGEARTADVVAQTPVRALLLSRADFDRVATTHPELRMMLTDVVASRLGTSAYDGLGGKDLHGYRIVRCVGRGGMGTVYEATRLGTSETVALKMLNHRLLYQPGAIQRFRREAEALEGLRHHSIARLYGSFAAYGTQFLVMEFCEGSTLKELLAGGRALDEDVVQRIVGQLAAALLYIHGQGLVHRDVKPSNVMTTRSGWIKLLDFGLVKSDPNWPDGGGANARTVSRSVGLHGTLRYMAPEQFGPGPIDHRADIYGLACVAYEALSGGPVIGGSDLLSMVADKLRFALPPAAQIGGGVSFAMHQFLTRGLDPLPEKRLVDLHRLALWAGPVDLGEPTRLLKNGRDDLPSTSTTRTA